MAGMRGKRTNDGFTSRPSREKQENWDWERRHSPASFYGSCFFVLSLFLSVSQGRVELKIHQGFVGLYPKCTCVSIKRTYGNMALHVCICFYWHVSPAFVYTSIYLCMWAPASKHICLLSGSRFNVLLGGPFVSCHEDPKTVWLTQFSSNFNINHSRVQYLCQRQDTGLRGPGQCMCGRLSE